MSHYSIRLIAGICLISLLSTSCLKEVSPGQKLPPSSSYFDFKIDRSVALSIDYGFKSKDYVVIFEIYDQNPMTEDEQGQSVKKEIEPIYRAATDGAGRFSAEIRLLSSLSKVWLYSDYSGIFSPIELEIKDNRIVYNQEEYLAKLQKSSSRAVNDNNFTYPDGWLRLGNWNQYGTPDYLDPVRTMPTSSTLYSINDVFVAHTNISLKQRYPDFFKPGLSSNIEIIKPTKVYLVFINSTAAWNNTVGYYTYPTGQEPQKQADVQRILAFPSTYPFIKVINNAPIRGALVAGERVQLKYWDGTQYQEEFPAGVSIGWWLEGMGAKTNDGNIGIQGNGAYARFSSDHLNTDGERRTIALVDPKSRKIVAIGFEDNADMRYNDATFYLEVDKEGSINDNIPTLPDHEGPTDELNYVKTDGFLMFEDLWPSEGDYDMNDVMIKYSIKVYKHILNNSVYKLESEFTPCHSGGQLQSAFGFQLTGITPEAVRRVTIDGETPSRFMEGQMLEPGQSRPTIILFDNVRSVINRTYNVTIELNDAPESAVAPPYNPFIIAEADKFRGKEVHLVKQMPTDKADKALFGTGHDGSRPKENLYYVLAKNANQYPFALNMPFLQNIPIPREGVKIDDSYPKFRSWVESGGKTNKDWYFYPAKK